MRSLSARLTLSAAVVLAVFIALTAFALERAFRDSARSARQERLLAQVYLLMAAAEVDGRGVLTLEREPAEPRLELPGSGLYATIVDAGGTAVWRSRSTLSADAPPVAPLPPGVQQFEETSHANGAAFLEQRFGVRWATPGGAFPFTFSVAEDLSAYGEQLARYRHALWGWLGAMAVLLLLGQWLLLRWGLRPLRHVANELTQLEAGLRGRIEGAYPSEIQRLTDTLNDVLRQERAQQKRYRDALADLAHSLKTPLAVMRASMLESPPQPALARALDEQVERMDRIVAYQLQRASATGRSRLAAAHPLRPAVQRILAALAKVHSGKPLRVDDTIDDGVVFRGDEGDLTELLGNLLDNAFKWAHSQIRVGASVDRGALILSVQDDGPGVPAEAAQAILERGTRADESVPGHGIGLAVVRDIVAAYDGRIEIGRGALGGAAVTVHIPAV
ncbi:MAG TPA: ATP-binding protein [Steroidobacteraceae bacterium]|nr:ATP-binding protein [Steroidobacteraceae bacterium]